MKKCMKCGGKVKMAKGGSAKSIINFKGLPLSGPTGENTSGVRSMKKGGTVKKYAEGGKTELGPVYSGPSGGRGGAGTYEPKKTTTTRTTKPMKKGGVVRKKK